MTHTVHAPSWSGTDIKPAHSHSCPSLADKDRAGDGEEESKAGAAGLNAPKSGWAANEGSGE